MREIRNREISPTPSEGTGGHIDRPCVARPFCSAALRCGTATMTKKNFPMTLTPHDWSTCASFIPHKGPSLAPVGRREMNAFPLNLCCPTRAIVSLDRCKHINIYLIHISLHQLLSAAETKKEKKGTGTVEQKQIRETRGSFSQCRPTKFSN